MHAHADISIQLFSKDSSIIGKKFEEILCVKLIFVLKLVGNFEEYCDRKSSHFLFDFSITFCVADIVFVPETLL